MNYRGQYSWVELENCPRCGRYAGARKVSVSFPEKFFIICEHCGYKTKPHTTQGHATNEWNHERKAKNAKN